MKTAGYGQMLPVRGTAELRAVTMRGIERPLRLPFAGFSLTGMNIDLCTGVCRRLVPMNAAAIIRLMVDDGGNKCVAPTKK